MAEVTQPGSPTPSAAPAAPAAPAEPQGLEKVYSDFKIEADAASFNPQSPQPATPAPAPVVPKIDPFDPNFAAHMADLSRKAGETQSALQQTQSRLSQMERQIVQRQNEADIKQAVGVLTEGNGIKPKVAEVALEAKAREDPRFLKLWNMRSQNPQAFNAALKALKGDFEQEYTVRQDPQLLENQRAVRASQQQMATTQKTTQQDKWAEMSPQERAAERARIMRAG